MKIDNSAKAITSIVYLTTFENPGGLMKLSAMLVHGIVPAAIIATRDEAQDTRIRKLFHERTGGRVKPPGLMEALGQQSIPFYFVASHNSTECENILRRYAVQLIVLGGADIIKKNILDIPSIGTINVHPGLLPEYRGCSAVEWALYNNEIPGATAHYVTEKIDRGDIVLKRQLALQPGWDYFRVRIEMYRLGGEVLVEAIGCIERGEKTMPCSGGKYYKTMPEAMLADLIKKRSEHTV